jgi:nucleoside-diphosphate-sugar epimerase
MRICVLGGTRFIGRSVVEHLLQRIAAPGGNTCKS